MTLSNSHYLSLRMAMGLMTFVIIALWLQLNTGADRAIQRQIANVEGIASAGLDYVLDLLPKPTKASQ